MTSQFHQQQLANAALARFLGQDPPRDEQRIAIRVRTRCATLVVAGVHVPWIDGKPVRGADGVRDVVLEIFESDLPQFEALVEDASREDVAMVKRQLDADFKEWTQPEDPGAKGRPAAEFPGSFEGSFTQLMRRSPRPLLELEVLKPRGVKKDDAKKDDAA